MSKKSALKALIPALLMAGMVPPSPSQMADRIVRRRREFDPSRLVAEYKLIQQKKSKLSAMKRAQVVSAVEDLVKRGVVDEANLES